MLKILRKKTDYYQQISIWPFCGRILSCFFVVILMMPMLSFAQKDIVRSEQELKSLQKKIALVKRNIVKQQEDETALLLELKKIEQQITRLQKEKLTHQQELIRSRRELREIKDKIEELQEKAGDMQDNLSQIVRTRYLLQDQNIIKLILNQEDPEAVSRSLIYYQNVAQAGDRFIQQVKKQEQDLQALTQDLDNKQREISQTLSSLQMREKEIEAKSAQRQNSLSQIRKQLKQENKQVAVYQNRQSELQLLIKQLRRNQEEKRRAEAAAKKAAEEAARKAEQIAKQQEKSSTDAPPPASIRRLPGDFAQAKGQMFLPVNGQLVQRFGDKDAESGVSYTGVMIAANEGQPVRAIHGGQVVYADWFRGYGQLMVIDHGDGYMSLYGHNQVLLAKLGDVVEVGTQIALAGTTGGLTNPGLYFEIRVQGEPEDPLRWCRA